MSLKGVLAVSVLFFFLAGCSTSNQMSRGCCAQQKVITVKSTPICCSQPTEVVRCPKNCNNCAYPVGRGLSGSNYNRQVWLDSDSDW
jgi:hypothetical protein